MTYKKVSDGEYKVTGSLAVWLEELKIAFEQITETLSGDKQAQWGTFLLLVSMSMGTKAKLKWEKGWLSRRKAKKMEYLLAAIKENKIPSIDVFDYLSENISLEELHEMKSDVVSNVSKALHANAKNSRPSDQITKESLGPSTNKDSLKLVTL